MRKTFSDSDICLSTKRGHNIHYYSLRALSENEFLPAKVKWRLDSKELEIDFAGQTKLFWNHNPFEVARALQVVTLERVSFCDHRSLLKVEYSPERLGFFSMATQDAGECLDHFYSSGWSRNGL